MELKGSKTEDNLKRAFAREAQANRRYIYYAAKADIEGYDSIAAIFRSSAEGEAGHAQGHLEYLENVADPVTGLAFGDTRQNLAVAIDSVKFEASKMYPDMAKTAREEGLLEIAHWFEALAKAEKSHAQRFQQALETADSTE